MSKTKFLGIPAGGKRAGWIEMEGVSSAGGGGVQVVRGDIDASTGLITFELTGNEIAELAKTSSVAVEIYYGDTLTQTLYLSCLVGDGAMANPVFIGASHNTSSITLSVISIPATSKNAPAISATLNAGS